MKISQFSFFTQPRLAMFYRKKVIVSSTFLCEYALSGVINVDEFSEQDLAEYLKNDHAIRSTINSVEDDQLQNVYGDQFIEFTEKFNRTYDNDDKRNRSFRIFCENMLKIDMLRKLEKGTATYGITKFADVSREEFRRKYMGYRRQENKQVENRTEEEQKMDENLTDKPIPEEFDWRDHNAVTPVKNQDGCGSCCAFSAIGNIEGLYAIKHNNELVSFSEQEIVDCAELNEVCGGGSLDEMYEIIKRIGGLQNDADYPFIGHQQEICKFRQDGIKVKLQGGFHLSSNEDKMLKWLHHYAPISIVMNADYLQSYTGGVQWLPDFLCIPQSLNHAVVAVGFGVQKTFLRLMNYPYWTMKNSWGKDWGEEGYFRIYRGAGVCGLNLESRSAIIV